VSRIETTVVIDRPIDDVWLFLSEPHNLPAWCPEAEQVTLLSDGPVSEGTRLMVSGRIGPLRIHSTQQVTAFEPERAIELRSVDGVVGGRLLARIDVRPDGARTSVTVTSDVHGLPRWLALLSPGQRKDRDAFLATLKRSLEARTGASAAPIVERTTVASPTRTEPPERRAPEPEQRGRRDREPEPPERRHPEPEPLAKVRPAAAHPGVVDDPIAPVEDTAAERGTEQDAPAPVTASGPAAESSAPDDPKVAAPGADHTVGPALAGEPATMPMPAADLERGKVPDAPPVEEERLVLRLETERGPAPSFEITRSGATIGRAPENTVRLDDLSVSRRHARISYRQGGYWLSDLKSASGTWVDEKKLSAPRRLTADQIIRIGILRLRVVIGAASEDMPTNRDRTPPPSELAGHVRRRR